MKKIHIQIMRSKRSLNMSFNLKVHKMSPDCLPDNTWKVLQPRLTITSAFLFAIKMCFFNVLAVFIVFLLLELGTICKNNYHTFLFHCVNICRGMLT